jgi:hypothetical protein
MSRESALGVSLAFLVHADTTMPVPIKRLTDEVDRYIESDLMFPLRHHVHAHLVLAVYVVPYSMYSIVYLRLCIVKR